MSDKVLIKPKAGLKLRDPVTKQHIPPEGEMKKESKYWRRLAAKGDVTIEKKGAVAKAAPAAKQEGVK